MHFQALLASSANRKAAKKKKKKVEKALVADASEAAKPES